MMGRSIATRVSQAGLGVVVRDITRERTDQVKDLLAKDWTRDRSMGLTQAEKKAILARIEFTVDLKETGSCDLVIETIHEDFAAKRPSSPSSTRS